MSLSFESLRGGRPSGRTVARLAFLAVVLVSGVAVVDGYAAAAADGGSFHPAAPPANGTTVVADQTGHLMVYGPSGALRKDFHKYQRYWDVDPVPGAGRTLLYVATERAKPSACAEDECVRNVVGRLNLTTGEHTRLYSMAVGTRGSAEWHDVDRVNDTAVVVADIKRDRVFIANTTTDEIGWQWNASEQFAPSSGGPPKDWTHLNDVEMLRDGRIMVSIRNQDQVVFIERGEGVQEDWTLGEAGNFSILHGQHNPDYIPNERGGPAILVADSHNNRAVEFQRRNGRWVQSWVWRDDRTQWTRDADRLPNGHTLITDTNGDRVLEVNRRGEIVWSVQAAHPYEAERLGTGDESAGGETAVALGLASRTGTDEVAAAGGLSASERFWQTVRGAVPPFLFNSLLFALPWWMAPTDVVALLVGAGVLLTWLAAESYWRRRRLFAAVGDVARAVK